MGTLQFEIKSEMNVREWFSAHIDEFDYSIIESGSGFPDYVMEDGAGKRFRTEVEYESANFIRHGHNPRRCDLVLCWMHNAELPLPVYELSTRTLHAPGNGAHGDYIVRYSPEKTLKESIFLACGEEFTAFMQAMIADMEAMTAWDGIMREPRLALLSAQAKLEKAIRERGGGGVLDKWGNLNPYDLRSKILIGNDKKVTDG